MGAQAVVLLLPSRYPNQHLCDKKVEEKVALHSWCRKGSLFL